MPAYDCGDPECEECKRAFGPYRSRAIANYHARERQYAELDRQRKDRELARMTQIAGAREP